MRIPLFPSYRLLLILLFSVFVIFSVDVLPQVNGIERDAAISMLDSTKDTIKRNYYDPTFHGVDIDFVFEQAKERIKVAPTRDAMMMTIASAVLAIDDSHTNFFPPSRAADVDYGWVVEMFGDDCYVTHVKPKSDAEAKGLKVGDKLLSIDNFKPIRKNLWQMDYRYFAIAPASMVTMTLLTPGDAKPHVLEIQTKITKTGGVITLQSWYDKAVVKHGWFDREKVNEYQQFGNDLLIWKMHTFAQPEDSLDAAVTKARKCKWLILDLRDNGGGYVDIEKRLIGYFFEKEIKIGDEKHRKETKPLVAKSHGGDLFTGNLIVLVDHGSASASEVFAKVIQLEKRGKIIGDKTAGAVMTSKFYDMENGFGNNLWFGATVTISDLVMTDGKSLEKLGVTPDEIVLPTGKDIAESKDPVLSYVAKLCGVELAPEKAGTFFPYEWPK